MFVRESDKKVSFEMPFQSGLDISICSLQGLYKDYNLKNTDIWCLFDVLKSYFSQNRGLGGFYDLLLLSAVSQRIKSLLSRNTTVIVLTETAHVMTWLHWLMT